MAGKEVVQIYVAPPCDGVPRPVHELRAFDKVSLRAGETKTVTFELTSRAFAYWDTSIHDWYVAPGEYTIEAGSSSRDIKFTKKISIEETSRRPMTITENTCFGDLLKIPEIAGELRPVVNSYLHKEKKDRPKSSEAISEKMEQEMLAFSPLRSVISFGDGEYDHEKLAKAIKAMQNKLDKK
jgi:beta-glucosidase